LDNLKNPSNVIGPGRPASILKDFELSLKKSLNSRENVKILINVLSMSLKKESLTNKTFLRKFGEEIKTF